MNTVPTGIAARLALSLSLAAAGGSAFAQCPATFAPATSWPMQSPFTVVTGDFNHDGKLDLAAANVNSSNATVRFADANQPAGTNFQPAIVIPLGLNPRGAAVADFNHDGVDDLAVNYNGGGPAATRLAVMLSNGNGTFQAPVLYLIPTQPNVMKVADFNHDGNPDLAILAANGTISIMLGNANGTFQDPTTAVTGTGINDFTVADLNNDGILDLAFANYNANGNSFVGVALGLSATSATFGAATNTSLPYYGAFGITRGDFNGDGRDDVAVTHSLVTSNKVQVVLSNADGSLVGQPVFSGGSQPIGVASADFNGDGRADVAVIGRNGSGVMVWLGNGSGGLVASATFAVTAGTNSITIADMNNDGRPDIVTADGTSGNASILLNTTALFAFTQQPFSRSVCPGGASSTVFSAAAATNVAGGITAYRWERLVGSTWTTMTTGTIAGVGDVSFSLNSSTMFISSVQGNAGDLVAKVRCVATNACGTLPSNPADLRIIRPCGGADVGATGGVYTGCGDGVLDNNDFVVFIDMFFNGNVMADVGSVGGVPGADGQFDNNDFVVYIDMFFSGCTI